MFIGLLFIIFVVEILLFMLSNLLGGNWRAIVFLPFIVLFIIELIMLAKDPDKVKDFFNNIRLNYSTWIEDVDMLWFTGIVGLLVFGFLFVRELL